MKFSVGGATVRKLLCFYINKPVWVRGVIHSNVDGWAFFSESGTLFTNIVLKVRKLCITLTTTSDYTVSHASWTTYFQANRVEHQKLNQTTPYGAVWLSFWCSTRPSADTGTDLYLSYHTHSSSSSYHLSIHWKVIQLVKLDHFPVIDRWWMTCRWWWMSMMW